MTFIQINPECFINLYNVNDIVIHSTGGTDKTYFISIFYNGAERATKYEVYEDYLSKRNLEKLLVYSVLIGKERRLYE